MIYRAYDRRRCNRLVLTTKICLILTLVFVPGKKSAFAAEEKLTRDVEASAKIRKGVLVQTRLYADNVILDVTAPEDASYQVYQVFKSTTVVPSSPKILTERLSLAVEFD